MEVSSFLINYVWGKNFMIPVWNHTPDLQNYLQKKIRGWSEEQSDTFCSVFAWSSDADSKEVRGLLECEYLILKVN